MIDRLPLELIYKILINVGVSDINNFCLISNVYRDVMFDRQFWIQKLNYDYPSNPPLSSFIEYRDGDDGDDGYSIYKRFDDGYNASHISSDHYKYIINKYNDIRTVNYAICIGDIKLLMQNIRTYGILPTQDAIDAACTLPNATHIMICISKYNIGPSQTGIDWATGILNINFLKWAHSQDIYQVL